MNILRWIISAPISIAIWGLLCIVIEWLLGWIFKILYYIMFWGTRYDVPKFFDWEYKLQDFKNFIFITCFSTLISAVISGIIGGLICPKNHSVATTWLFGIIIIPILIFSCVAFWDTEHWFYSSVWIIDMIISGILFVAGAVGANSALKNN